MFSKSKNVAELAAQNSHVQILNPDFGDEILYIEGQPRDYRFDARNGTFKLGEEEILTDHNGQPLKSFTFQPLAWRIFTDTLFGREREEIWAEIFFVDSENCLSVIMFNNSSVKELQKLIQPLFYKRKKLSEVVLTMTPESHENTKIKPKATYFIAKFKMEDAMPERIEAFGQYADCNRIYRLDTLTNGAIYHFVADCFYNALAEQEKEEPTIEEFKQAA